MIMCGFFVIIGPMGTMPKSDCLREALDTLSNRGPDGEGLVNFEIPEQNLEIIMGHRRLSIVGLDNGKQPIETPNTLSVVNGEFYDYVGIRNGLKANGAVFKTESDSEILPWMYELQNTVNLEDKAREVISRLKGEWAFVLVDKNTGQLIAGCDPFGTKPLRWYKTPDGKTLMLASEAKALFKLGAPKEIDTKSLNFAMEFQYTPIGDTLFKHISNIEPGGFLTTSPTNKDLVVKLGQHWSALTQTSWLQSTIKQIKDLKDVKFRTRNQNRGYTANIRCLLEKAVSRRLPSERQFSTHLSGGIDSAIITALSGRLSGQKIPAYCASFPWAGQGDETSFAKRTADFLGADFRPVVMTPEQLLSAMDEAPYRAEGLSINLHAGAKILVAEAIRRDGLRVTMTGEGADETFFGYEHFRYDFPEGQRPLSGDINQLSVGIMRPDQNADLVSCDNLTKILGCLPSWIKTKISAGRKIHSCLGPALYQGFEPEDIIKTSSNEYLGASQYSPLMVARGLWSQYCMSGYILRGLDDAMGMSRRVESRLAYLDTDLVEYVSSIPPIEHFGPDGIEKYLLRQAVRDIFPDDILNRPKRAFLVPSVLDMPIGKEWASNHLSSARLTDTGLFNRQGLDALLASPSSPVRDANIMTLCSLSRLMDVYDL